jgi:hypothetical protein
MRASEVVAEHGIFRSAAMADTLLGVGLPDLAHRLVGDSGKRFELAVKVGDIDSALRMAMKLKRKEVWTKLAETAVFHGRLRVAETALRNSDDVAGLSFLFIVTGQLEKLRKVGTGTAWAKDAGLEFVNGACSGCVMQQAAALRARGLTRLADHGLRTHGLGSGEGIGDTLVESRVPLAIMREKQEKRESKAMLEMTQSHTAGYALPMVCSDSPSSSHLARPYTRFSDPQFLLPPLLLSADACDWPLLPVTRAPLPRPLSV